MEIFVGCLMRDCDNRVWIIVATLKSQEVTGNGTVSLH
jgi:hypothetical protein